MTQRRTTTEAPKDFLAVKGRFSLHVTPRTPQGWRLMFAWIGGLLLPYLPFTLWAAAVDDTASEQWVVIATAPMLLLTAMTIWVMIRWILKHADIVSPSDLHEAARNRSAGPNKRRR